MLIHSQANKTPLHKKGCAPSLDLKVRVFGTRGGGLFAQATRCSCPVLCDVTLAGEVGQQTKVEKIESPVAGSSFSRILF